MSAVRNWLEEIGLAQYADAFDREGFDRLGKTLYRLPPEICQPEQAADKAAGGAGEDDLPGFRQSL